MKRRTFGDGGGVPPGGRFDADTYARARAWIAAGSPEQKDDAPKASSKPTKKASPAPKPAPAAKATPAPSPAPSSSAKAEIPKDTSVKAPAKNTRDRGRGMTDLERNVLNTVGAVSGLRGFKPVLAAGKKAVDAVKGSRAIAKSETPVTFLGASGRKNITPKEAIGGSDRARLTSNAGDRVKQLGGPKALPAPKAAADTPKLPAPKKPVKTPTPRKPKVSAGRGTKKPSVSLTGGKSLTGKPRPKDRTRFDDNSGIEFKRGGKVK